MTMGKCAWNNVTPYVRYQYEQEFEALLRVVAFNEL